MTSALLADPYAVLFGALLLLAGAGGVLAALLKRHGDLAWPLAAVFGTSACVWLGLLALDLTRIVAADVRPQAVDPRWVLFPAAALLLVTGSKILVVYGAHTSGDHAWEYRTAAQLIAAVSFAALLGLLVQPLFA